MEEKAGGTNIRGQVIVEAPNTILSTRRRVFTILGSIGTISLIITGYFIIKVILDIISSPPYDIDIPLVLFITLIIAFTGIFLLWWFLLRMNRFALYENGVQPTIKCGKLMSLSDTFIPFENIENIIIEEYPDDKAMPGDRPVYIIKIFDKNGRKSAVSMVDILWQITDKKKIDIIYDKVLDTFKNLQSEKIIIKTFRAGKGRPAQERKI